MIYLTPTELTGITVNLNMVSNQLKQCLQVIYSRWSKSLHLNIRIKLLKCLPSYLCKFFHERIIIPRIKCIVKGVQCWQRVNATKCTISTKQRDVSDEFENNFVRVKFQRFVCEQGR